MGMEEKTYTCLAQTIDKLASILPFEPSYYPDDAPIEYVGHPLLDIITQHKKEIASKIDTIAFMPGSRKGEIRKLMPIFHELVQKIEKKAVIIIPPHFSEDEVQELYGDLSRFEIVQDAHKTLLEVDFAFICSGTATLEASLIGTPFILTYIANKFDYFIASRLVKLNYLGLGNIMFEKFAHRALHPEFIQDEVSVNALLEAYQKYDREKFFQDSQALNGYLQHGSSKRVAKIIEGS
jgi:lipid-A-disaccharide synthase